MNTRPEKSRGQEPPVTIPSSRTASPVDERGMTLIEMGMALLVVAALIVIALPFFRGVRDQSAETAAQAELREALIPLRAHLLDGDSTLSLQAGIRVFSGTVIFDATAVAGVKVQAAADGATCLWRRADTGQTFGIWTSPDTKGTLYAELGALPATCPTAANTAAVGFVPSW